MDNVIHRSFVSNKKSSGGNDKNTDPTGGGNFCAYGVAGGTVVGISRCVEDGERSYLEILVKSLDGNDHTVGSFDDTPEGHMHAEITTMAILRAISVVI